MFKALSISLNLFTFTEIDNLLKRKFELHEKNRLENGKRI